MWYFTWILGLGLALAFGVLNGVWYEFNLTDEGDIGASAVGATIRRRPVSAALTVIKRRSGSCDGRRETGFGPSRQDL